MQNGIFNMLVFTMLSASFSSVSATSSAFWDNLSDAKVTSQSSTRYSQPRTRFEQPRKSRISTQKTARRSSTNVSSSCSVNAAARLPSRCVVKNSATRKGLISQINYLRSNAAATSASGIRQASYRDVGRSRLLNTANTLLDWFDGYNANALADHFELHELDARKGKVKYTGYFTPFISARRYPSGDYAHPIYGAPRGNYPNRREIFKGALRGKGLEIAWTNDPVSYYQAQVQGSGVLSFPKGELVDLHFAGNSSAAFVSVASYMHNKGYIKTPSSKAMRVWLERHPDRLHQVLAVNPRFVFFKMSRHKNTRKTASGQPLIAGHTVAVDTQHIPFGSVLLAEIPMRNSKGKITGREWRLLFPQDRGGAIKGSTHLDLYTGEGLKAKQLTSKITGVGRAYLLVKKQGRGNVRTASAR